MYVWINTVCLPMIDFPKKWSASKVSNGYVLICNIQMYTNEHSIRCCIYQLFFQKA